MLFCRCVCSLTGLGIHAGKDSVPRLQINPYSYLMGLWVSPLQLHDLHFADLWESLSFSCSYCALLGVTFRKCLNILNSIGCCYFTCLFIYLGIFCWRHAEVSIPLSQHSHLHFFFVFTWNANRKDTAGVIPMAAAIQKFTPFACLAQIRGLGPFCTQCMVQPGSSPDGSAHSRPSEYSIYLGENLTV